MPAEPGHSTLKPAAVADPLDWRRARRRTRNRLWLALFAVLAAVILGGGTVLSYYVEALWFDSLGFSDVFWKTLNFQASIFTTFTAVTFALLFGGFLALKPGRLADLTSGPLLINGQPIRL